MAYTQSLLRGHRWEGDEPWNWDEKERWAAAEENFKRAANRRIERHRYVERLLEERSAAMLQCTHRLLRWQIMHGHVSAIVHKSVIAQHLSICCKPPNGMHMDLRVASDSAMMLNAGSGKKVRRQPRRRVTRHMVAAAAVAMAWMIMVLHLASHIAVTSLAITRSCTWRMQVCWDSGGYQFDTYSHDDFSHTMHSSSLSVCLVCSSPHCHFKLQKCNQLI